MSKFLPPPPGAFAPPPGNFAPPGGVKAPLAAPGGFKAAPMPAGNHSSPAPFPNNNNNNNNNTFSAPAPNNAMTGAPAPFASKAPMNFPPSASNGPSGFVPLSAPNNNNNNGNVGGGVGPKSFSLPPPPNAGSNGFQQQQQQQNATIAQPPQNASASKYCPQGAPSPSAPSPSSSMNSNNGNIINNNNNNNNANAAPTATFPGKFSPPPAGKFPAPAPFSPLSSSADANNNSNNNNSGTPTTAATSSQSFPRPGGAPAPFNAPKTFSQPPLQQQQQQPLPANNNNNNTSNASVGPFPSPAPGKGFPAPFAAGGGKSFLPPPPNGTSTATTANTANNSVAPSPSPARPPLNGFPTPAGFNNNNNNGSNSVPQNFPTPQGKPGAFVPPSLGFNNNSGGAKAPMNFPLPGGKGGFPAPPGFGGANANVNNVNNNNNNMNNNIIQQHQNNQPQPFNNNNNNNNNNMMLSNTNNNMQQNNNLNNTNNFMGSAANSNNNMQLTSGNSTPGSQNLSYSSPVSTGISTNNTNNNNSNGANNSFNKLPDSQQDSQQQQQRPSSSSGGNIPQNSGKARMRAKPQGQNRIDSLQMPSPCRDLLVDGHPDYRYPPKPFNTAKSVQVPPTSVSCTPCIDECNCLPKFIRPTLHQLPWEENALDKAKTPWGAVISPLASKSVNIGGSSLPLVNAPGTDPVRCSRCRAYMTAWNPFAGTGHSWVCAFCGMSNEVSEAYFSPITNNGKRRDYLDRPELCHGSYEIDVSGMEKYFAENPDTQKHIRPKPMNHLFVIDVSKNTQPHMKTLVAGIREAVDQMPLSGYGMCAVSFVTYASTLHFYDFSDPKMPQMIVPDVDTPFVPLPFNLLCWMNVEKQRDRIEAFLTLLEDGSIVDAVDETGCVLGAAAKVGQLILADVGGMIIMTGTTMPTAGCGIIPERDSKFHGDPKKEPELFKPQPGFWPNLAADCAKRFVSFTLIMFPSANACDMITVGQLPHLTNGKQWTFANFRDESDGLRLKRRLIHALNDEAGYGAILRTRCSAGIRVKNYHGHFMQTDPQDMDLAAVDSQSSFYVAFTHDGKLEKKGGGIVQIALLYTTRSGFRRVRVHNLRMNVADTISNMFRFADIESTVQAFISLAIHEAFNKGVKAARDWIIAKTVDLLVGYRVYSQSGSHSGQLLLPENLKLLAIYNLCLLKSDALVSGTSARFEDRVQNMFELLSYPPDQLLFYLYPRLFGLHYLSQNAGEYRLSAGDGAEEEEVEIGSRPKVFLPGLIQLTADNVYQGGIYLLQDLQARVVILLIGSQVSPSILESTFGCEYVEGSAGSYYNMINSISASTMDKWNPRVRRIVQQIIDETGRFVIVKEKQEGQMEDAFFRNLLEDQGPDREACYSEFLCSLHKQINTKAKTM